ncbi:hypothetical protein [Sinomonas notoginsengisoli]|uniref:hypothetical protein n=1 Tax=Sinomonas notoginsengisoli TaxID=1457311 RepID=UPI001F45CDBE|nr:hypothetical protein [Sinomonas notoginsengisoli]
MTSPQLVRPARVMNTQRSFYSLTVQNLADRAGVGLRTMHGWLRAENAPQVASRGALP